MSEIVLVVAIADNGVIGKDGGIPWHISEDMKRFKALTMGHTIVMGRKTWDSLPKKPLPGRTNIVLSRDLSFEPERAIACETFSEATQIGREQAADDGVDEVCVIGGSALFELALPKARRLYLTEVEAEVEGDVFFPSFDEAEWEEVRRESHPAGEDDEFPFTFRVLERR